MKKNDQATVTYLNALIETCRDGQRGFEVASESVTGELAEQLRQYALQRAQFVRELQNRVRILGGDAESAGSMPGALHRGWMDLKTAISANNPHAILSECERGEDVVVTAYRDALASDTLDEESRGIIQRQYEAVQSVHDRVKQLRDRAVYRETEGTTASKSDQSEDRMNPSDKIMTWLRDAHAMERSMERVLQNHVKAAEGYPEIRDRLNQHLLETRAQADRIDRCLRDHGHAPSAIKSTAASVMGMIEGSSTMLFGDELVKNILADYAMEHFEIACYTALIAAAEEVGDETIAETCREILREEQAMATWLEENTSRITCDYLRQVAADAGR